MKSIVVNNFGGPEVLEYMDVEVPDINESQVLIKVEKTSVNFADIKSRYGNKGKKTPFTPGLDCAGVVEQVGSQVKDIHKGQRVIAFPSSGAYSEYVVADENLTFPISDQLSFSDAAASPTVSFLAYKLINDIGRLEEGENVLIHSASGGVGTTAIQLAKIAGAKTIIGTVGDLKKADIAKEVGADYVISHEDHNFAEQVNELTNGEGVDVVLDSISGRVSEESLNCLADYGRLVHFGNSSDEVGNIQTKDLHASCRQVLGFSLGTTRKKRPHLLKEVAKNVFNLMLEGHLKVKVGHEYKLSDVQSAHKLMESRKSVGKILLDAKS
ncbi:quinone oxidoreductase [Filobacillus milosensis]|uniref:Quinone oxidoreductase n=1 Tax=Filobacillus milosensis TaxID=94137 RepID=A0A4Y8IRZ7_9BACI|nr:zinc-binding dehydrogenase [Filobacillus milosensis]TFB21383.1 quinone oxidoreductase [Filobacillus milosensis]